MYNEYNNFDNFDDFSNFGGRRNCTIQEYRKRYAKKEYYKTMNTYCIVGYIVCGLMGVITVLADPWGLIDVAIQIGCLLGVHLGRSKGCAIGLTAYSVINMAILLIDTGKVGGWLWVALAVGILDVFKKIDKDYKSRSYNQM